MQLPGAHATVAKGAMIVTSAAICAAGTSRRVQHMVKGLCLSTHSVYNVHQLLLGIAPAARASQMLLIAPAQLGF
jgi:hypothetical protein